MYSVRSNLAAGDIYMYMYIGSGFTPKSRLFVLSSRSNESAEPSAVYHARTHEKYACAYTRNTHAADTHAVQIRSYQLLHMG